MDDKQLEALGAQVRAARLRRGMSKEGVARGAEVSSITYKRVEDGLPVREDSLAKILGFFDLPMPGADMEPIHTDDVERLRRLIEQSNVSPALRQRVLDALPERGDGDAEDSRGAAPMTGT